MIPIEYYLALSAFLFCVGLATLLTKRNLMGILVGIELLFNAATLNFIGFCRYDSQAQGQLVVIFVIALVTIETAIGLAIAYQLYAYLKTDEISKFNQLKEK